MTSPPDLTHLVPEVVDSSMLSTFSTCPRKFYYRYILNLQPTTHRLSIHLHAGKCFASGCEAARLAFHYEHLDADLALGRGLEALWKEWGYFVEDPDDKKTLPAMSGALVAYFDNFPLASEKPYLVMGRPAVEFSFADPLPVDHPSGQPFILSGRFDYIVHFANALWGMDEKTASRLGPSWESQWDLRPQFSAYTYGAANAGIKLEGFLVRGVGIYLRDYGFAEIPTYRPPFLLDRWLQRTTCSLKQIVAMAETNHWPTNEGEACHAFNTRCPYMSLCASANPFQGLRSGYQAIRWNPATRTEEVLPETFLPSHPPGD